MIKENLNNKRKYINIQTRFPSAIVVRYNKTTQIALYANSNAFLCFHLCFLVTLALSFLVFASADTAFY